MDIRFMIPGERGYVEAFKKTSKAASEFIYTWTRWKNWEKSPPVVAAVELYDIVGFHGVSFTKSGYINSAFQFVHELHRGEGLAGDMVSFILEEGVKRGASRLRFRCSTPEGDAFWQGFNLTPMGKTEKEHWYDLSIAGVSSASELFERGEELCRIPTTDKRTIGHYKRSGVEPLLDWSYTILLRKD